MTKTETLSPDALLRRVRNTIAGGLMTERAITAVDHMMDSARRGTSRLEAKEWQPSRSGLPVYVSKDMRHVGLSYADHRGSVYVNNPQGVITKHADTFEWCKPYTSACSRPSRFLASRDGKHFAYTLGDLDGMRLYLDGTKLKIPGEVEGFGFIDSGLVYIYRDQEPCDAPKEMRHSSFCFFNYYICWPGGTAGPYTLPHQPSMTCDNNTAYVQIGDRLLRVTGGNPHVEHIRPDEMPIPDRTIHRNTRYRALVVKTSPYPNEHYELRIADVTKEEPPVLLYEFDGHGVYDLQPFGDGAFACIGMSTKQGNRVIVFTTGGTYWTSHPFPDPRHLITSADGKHWAVIIKPGDYKEHDSLLVVDGDFMAPDEFVTHAEFVGDSLLYLAVDMNDEVPITHFKQIKW